MTETQFDNSVLDILQVSGNPAVGQGVATDDTSLEQRATVAATIAGQAVANVSKWSPCTPPASGSSTACEMQIISQVGAKLYRHPLSTSEQTELKTLFDAGIKEKDFTTGLTWFLTGILQAPDFMYQVVRPAATETPGQVISLSPYEYASRLSYFIWDGPPDDMLTAAAASNDLADATKRDTQVKRMLQDGRFSRGVAQFYTQWLNINAFSELSRDTTGFDQTVASALATSLLMSATQVYTSANPNISSLFSGNQYYMNDVLRKFYGVSGSGTAFMPVTMSGQSRRGILTHPGLMALIARPEQSYPIGRGHFILSNILCVAVPPPPANLMIPSLPAVQAGVSTRQQVDMHASTALCSACHGLLDPPGFALEDFDEAGRFRTTDQGQPVDTSGSISIQKDVDGTFASGDDFLAKFADSQDVRNCFAENYVDYALGHAVTDASDACSIQTIAQSFAPSGDLKQLVVGVAESDSFRMRLAQGVGQ